MAVLGRPFFCGHIPDEHFISLNIIIKFLFGKYCGILLTDQSCVPMERPSIFNSLAIDEMFLLNNEIH